MLRATKYDTGEGLQNYSMGSTFGSMSFSAIMLCLLSDPIKECRYEGQKQSTEDMPLVWRSSQSSNLENWLWRTVVS